MSRMNLNQGGLSTRASLSNIHQDSIKGVSNKQITKMPGDTLTLVVDYSYAGPGNWTDQFHVGLWYIGLLGVVVEVTNTGWPQEFPVSYSEVAQTPVALETTLPYKIQSGRNGNYGVLIYLVNNKDAGVIYLDVPAEDASIVNIGGTAATITGLTVVSFS